MRYLFRVVSPEFFRWIAFPFAAVLLLTGASASACQQLWEPIVVPGSKLYPLVAAQDNQLEVLALHNHQLAPIPFQLDEVRSDGEFALSEGPHPLVSDHPNIFGLRDEVAMMFSDLGERVADTRLLPFKALEIEVTASPGAASRYAYIAAVDKPSHSSRQYVHYEPELQSVRTDDYGLTMKNELPDIFALERSGTNSETIAHGFEASASARLLKLFPIGFSERDVKSEIVAYKLGPIRLIRKLRHRVSLGLGIDSPSVTRTDFFYRDSIDEPLIIHLPWIPRILFGDIRVRVDMVLQSTSGLTLSWSGVDGSNFRVSDPALDMNVKAHPVANWLTLRDQDAALVGGFLPAPALDALTLQLYYRGPGGVLNSQADPRIGYLLTGWEGLSKGPHRVDFTLIQVSIKCAGPLWQEVSNPPTVKIRSVGPGG